MCLPTTVIKGVQRDFPLAGVWGYPPAIHIPPLLEKRGIGVEVNGHSSTPKVIASRVLLSLRIPIEPVIARLDGAIQKLAPHVYLDHTVKPDDDLEKMPDDDIEKLLDDDPLVG
jgi:hypothetical protein